MLMVTLKSSIPVVTVGFPKSAAFCEWECHLQMEKKKNMCLFLCGPPPLGPSQEAQSHFQSSCVRETLSHLCVSLSRTVIYYWYSFYVFSWLTLFVTCSRKTWCVVYHIFSEKCPSAVMGFLIMTPLDLNLETAILQLTERTLFLEQQDRFGSHRCGFYTRGTQFSEESLLIHTSASEIKSGPQYFKAIKKGIKLCNSPFLQRGYKKNTSLFACHLTSRLTD